MSRKSKLKQQKKVLSGLEPLLLEMAGALDSLQEETKELRQVTAALRQENEALKVNLNRIVSLLQRG